MQIYFKFFFYKIAVISNFLAFFLFFFEKCSLLDPDQGGKMNADPDPQPWFCECMFYAMVYIRIRIEISYVDPDLHNWDRDLPDPDLEADVDPVS